MKKVALFFALALTVVFATSGCSPRMARGLAAAAVITGAVVQTAAELSHAERRRRHRHRCRRHCHHRHYDSGHYRDCCRCH